MAAFAREVSRPSRKASAASGGPYSRHASSDSGFARQLSKEEIAFHKETTAIAKDVLTKLMDAGDGEVFDKADGSDGLGPPSADVPDAHFKRRLLANEVLAATEDYMYDVRWNVPQHAAAEAAAGEAGASPKGGAGTPGTVSCLNLGYLGEGARVHPVVSEALETALRERGLLLEAAAFDQFAARSDTRRGLGAVAALPGAAAARRAPPGDGFKARAQSVQVGTLARLRSGQRKAAGYDPDAAATLKSLTRPVRRASVLHDGVKHALKNHGPDAERLVPPSSEKPALRDPVGLRCVEHLYDPKWTRLARAIRESIYDPDFYDDGTYGPMYVRLAIHGAATWDQHDRTGGLEGGAMRYKPEYSDAHNKFCKEVVKRQHELLKVPFPWASYADIQCLCSYVALECADGPVIPFTPGRRDIAPNKSLADPVKDLGDDDFVYLNYRERGDAGCEDAPVRRCPASGRAAAAGAGECPFLTKARVMPGRLPGPEAGHLGKPFAPVRPEDEARELREVAREVRHIFVDRIGASEQFTVALIAGGHSLGRCHPQVSGYAGPWQDNPGYFNNVYCKKLLSEDWKLVDRNMEDCSGDVITGLRPYGMRRQYVNEGGRGDIMMLVSDMALKDDPQFGYWIQHYALDNEALKRDFAAAFKWITEVGFEPPREKRGLAKLLFHLRKFRADALKWVGEHLCPDANDGAAGGPVFIAADAPKVGKPYTLDDVKAHASKDDCWVAINGKVCDLTKFMGTHPGGVGPIMSKAGTDASSEWNTIHNKDAIEKICPEVVVGYLVASKSEGAEVPPSLMGA